MKTIKKLANSIIIVLIAFTQINCKKYDLDAPSNNIVGNWKEVYYLLQANDVGPFNTHWVTISTNNALNYQFKYDSTFTIQNYSWYNNCKPLKFTYLNSVQNPVIITRFDCLDRAPTSLDTLRVLKLSKDSLIVYVKAGWFGGYSMKFIRNN